MLISSKFFIRFERRGRYKFPLYNIVVSKSRSNQYGKFYSKIGVYVPLYSKRLFFIDLKQLSFWLSRGAVVKAPLSKLILSLLRF